MKELKRKRGGSVNIEFQWITVIGRYIFFHIYGMLNFPNGGLDASLNTLGSITSMLTLIRYILVHLNNDYT